MALPVHAQQEAGEVLPGQEELMGRNRARLPALEQLLGAAFPGDPRGRRHTLMTETTGSQKSRMLAGHLYDASDPELRADRERAALLMYHYNQARPGDPAAGRILADLLGGLGENCELRPPFYCDYGYNIRI